MKMVSIFNDSYLAFKTNGFPFSVLWLVILLIFGNMTNLLLFRRCAVASKKYALTRKERASHSLHRMTMYGSTSPRSDNQYAGTYSYVFFTFYRCRKWHFWGRCSSQHFWNWGRWIWGELLREEGRLPRPGTVRTLLGKSDFLSEHPKNMSTRFT